MTPPTGARRTYNIASSVCADCLPVPLPPGSHLNQTGLRMPGSTRMLPSWGLSTCRSFCWNILPKMSVQLTPSFLQVSAPLF